MHLMYPGKDLHTMKTGFPVTTAETEKHIRNRKLNHSLSKTDN